MADYRCAEALRSRFYKSGNSPDNAKDFVYNCGLFRRSAILGTFAPR
ncbi:hypothetical protein RYQ91_001983 [Salmonella enterica]|nr:hypothetical protein [Salmonella enterica]ELM3344825.1 hypothetical protein [Salmonella enterica]